MSSELLDSRGDKLGAQRPDPPVDLVTDRVDRVRAMVTAGFAKLVDDVNQ